jgi:tetratricopeptide (TPR) repeat protein
LFLRITPKQTLQLASVIGREFTYRLLDRLTDIQGQVEGYLQELKAIELIYETSVFPELVYMFKHALTQDVAYHSLLVQRRQALHRLVGQAIEELYADRLAEYYEVLAYHFAKGQDWAKAFAYFRQAGEKASQAFANREAIALYDQALEAADQLGDLVDGHVMIAIHQAKANGFFALSDFEQAIAEGQQALHLARQCDDRKREGMALAGMGLASLFNHEFDRTLAYSRQAITVAQEADVKPAIAVSHFTIGSTSILTARLTEGKQELEQALAVSQWADDVAAQALALGQLAFVREWKGEFNDALHLASQSLQIARQHNQLFPLLLCYFSQGLAYTGRGDYDDALTALNDGFALAEKSGEQFWRLRFLNSLGWLYSECGNLDLALHYNQLGAEEARKRGESETIANTELNLADVFFARGDFTLAHELLDGVPRQVRDPATSDWMKWRYSTHLFASLGELHLARGELHQAQESINQCLEIATRTHSQKYIVKGWRLQGQIALAQHDHDEAGRWFQQALSLAQSVSNPTQLWQTHLALGRLHSAMRHGERDKQAYQAARTVIDQTRTKIRTPELLANLARSPLMQRVYDLGES